MYALNKHTYGNKTIFARREKKRIFKISEQFKR